MQKRPFCGSPDDAHIEPGKRKMSLTRDEFPLSAKYDPEWVFENQMGINALWLTE
jgi:hypothetical protein